MIYNGKKNYYMFIQTTVYVLFYFLLLSYVKNTFIYIIYKIDMKAVGLNLYYGR